MMVNELIKLCLGRLNDGDSVSSTIIIGVQVANVQ